MTANDLNPATTTPAIQLGPACRARLSNGDVCRSRDRHASPNVFDGHLVCSRGHVLPAQNTHRMTKRNGPCRCGSGVKAKRCCLD